MTREAGFKRRVRTRMAATGESYAAARTHLDSRPQLLHVTNGDSTARSLHQGGVEGEVIAWRDVLHEGPVPALAPAALARVRAHFLAETGAGPAAAIERELRERDRMLGRGATREIVLWFEADLYDQLQLIQVLDRLAGAPARSVSLVSIGEYPGRAHFGGLGELPTAQLLALRQTAGVNVEPSTHALGRRAWAAFTSPDPSGLPLIAQEQSSVLRHLGEAIERLLQEYPWTDDGLSLTERRVLRAVEAGATTAHDVFQHVWRRERRPFMAATWCHRVIERMIRAGLLASAPTLVRTARDHLDAVDRWIGGVHLRGAPRWRWDPRSETLVASG